MADHQQAVEVIEQLVSHATDFGYGDLDHSHLEQFGIQVTSFNLEDDKASPICTPWPRPSFDKAFAKVKLSDWAPHERPDDEETVYPMDNGRYALWCKDYLCDCFGDRVYRESLATGRRWEQQMSPVPTIRVISGDGWGMERMYQVVEHKQNHLGTVLVDKADANKPLRRGELITAIHLMRCALTRSKTAVETPAMVYSIAGGTQARVIHTYIEGHNLIVLKSNYVKIWKGYENNTKLYLRWVLNDPIGADTDIEADKPDRWDFDPHTVFPAPRRRRRA